MENDTLTLTHLIASEGKVFRRIEDGVIMGKEIYLGKTYYLDDEELQTPIEEKESDFEQVDENTIEVDKDTIAEQIKLLNQILEILKGDEYPTVFDCGKYAVGVE